MVPKKRSPTTGKEVYAFAKTDKAFLDLQNDPNWGPYVAARLAFKSTLEEARLQRLQDIVDARDDFKLPVPVTYYGAHTGRFSGADKINLQNMPRGSVIRDAIHAGPGKVLIAADLAQIEARFTACLAGENDLIHAFATGADVYSDFASGVYKIPVNKHDYPAQRFVGKTAILSMQYQVGGAKFHSTMNNVHLTHMEMSEADRVVRAYRKRYKKIVDLWDKLQRLVQWMATADEGEIQKLGPVKFMRHRVILPNGMPMYYHNLRRVGDNMNHVYTSNKGGTVTLYGGKLLENISQACCRIILTTAQLRLAEHNWFAALSVHDELIYTCEEDNASLVSRAIGRVMEEPVEWMPNLPIKCEVEIGRTYSECK
jgi:DNA polymerase